MKFDVVGSEAGVASIGLPCVLEVILCGEGDHFFGVADSSPEAQLTFTPLISVLLNG